MEKRETISILLGASQLEMATLLKITRSQWSMYELGKRSLPLAAAQQLSEILAQVQPQKRAKKQVPTAEQQAQKKQTLEALLRENEYQQLVVERKIAGIQKKQVAAVAALQLLGYLADTDKKTTPPHLLQSMETKAKRKAAENSDAVLITHQIKQELLKYEAELLKNAITSLVSESVVVKK
ncbi:helix-turn-helix transcriptional regulator [Flavobacterium sp. 102]|uniref:helix-turn-helix domain-containing protein n=2 Tax=unclassified Flavobacterium TaxID=196869 RepID=UPI000F10EFF5|nr:helix-turn-helix transcriptional regulator [Flavobacterium sp. 102]RKS02736.1 hypothetical protein C8C84_2465 [Flavobacterium sp. 102]